MSAPIPLEEAWERLLALARPLGSETIAVEAAVGRYLATGLAARRTQPASDLSAMDGFAIGGPGPWGIVGESRQAPRSRALLLQGKRRTSRPGRPVPRGTEGIVPIEDAQVEGAELRAAAPHPGAHIRRRGFDFADGDELIASGTRIGPAQLALARAAGHATLTVAHQPRLAIVECGDELASDPAHCPPERLPATNGAMVGAMVAGLAAEIERIGPLADDRAALVDAFTAAADADVLVTTAGASVGEHDHVRRALEDCGADLAFWRVAIRPGKPLLVAQRGHQLVLGLPGNPASSFVTAFLFLLPLLRALQGAIRPQPEPLPIPLAEALPAGGPRREFVRARLIDGRAVALEEQDSSALRTLAAADLLIDRQIGAPGVPAGTAVPCYCLGNGGIA